MSLHRGVSRPAASEEVIGQALTDLHARLAIGEFLEVDLARLRAETVTNGLDELRVRGAAEDARLPHAYRRFNQGRGWRRVQAVTRRMSIFGVRLEGWRALGLVDRRLHDECSLDHSDEFFRKFIVGSDVDDSAPVDRSFPGTRLIARSAANT